MLLLRTREAHLQVYYDVFKLLGYFLDLSVETLEKEVQLNYIGTLYTVKAALPFMVERNSGGHFVLVSSAGFSRQFSYPVSRIWQFLGVHKLRCHQAGCSRYCQRLLTL